MTRKMAKELLQKGAKANPGPWVAHSEFVAIAAEKIAKACPHLDPGKAYLYGLLHDIGKSDPLAQRRHPLVGFDMMERMDEHEIAQICLTHPFTLKMFEETLACDDYSEGEKERITKLLDRIEFSDYDRLIQLCDSIALPQGIVILEKRLFDIHIRHGFNEYTVSRWKRLIELKDYFESFIGNSLYALFPDCMKTTVETDLK